MYSFTRFRRKQSDIQWEIPSLNHMYISQRYSPISGGNFPASMSLGGGRLVIHTIFPRRIRKLSILVSIRACCMTIHLGRQLLLLEPRLLHLTNYLGGFFVWERLNTITVLHTLVTIKAGSRTVNLIKLRPLCSERLNV